MRKGVGVPTDASGSPEGSDATSDATGYVDVEIRDDQSTVAPQFPSSPRGDSSSGKVSLVSQDCGM